MGESALVSKIRVLLGMLVLLALAIGSVALLMAMDVEAGSAWFTIVPLGILVTGATVVQSLGWFNKKGR